MTAKRPILALAVALATLALASARWTSRAQDRPEEPRAQPPQPRHTVPVAEAAAARESRPTVQEALLRVYPLPFGDETTLDEVVAHLRTTLGAPVVLDPAALERQELTPEATVRLDLDGVRLKTGLELLLGQVGLTYRVIPEDNLLVLTDAQGSDDPSSQIRDEVKSLHRDVHDLQDAVEELYQALVPEDEEDRVLPIPTLVTRDPAGLRPASPRRPARSRPRLAR
ncbi:MAG TPA: hypothetical protein VF590_13835 [Isosphaeraceae bacterium]|jgi:hypothetical protein